MFATVPLHYDYYGWDCTSIMNHNGMVLKQSVVAKIMEPINIFCKNRLLRSAFGLPRNDTLNLEFYSQGDSMGVAQVAVRNKRVIEGGVHQAKSQPDGKA